MPAIDLSRVLLPQPDGPSRARNSPFCTERERSERIVSFCSATVRPQSCSSIRHVLSYSGG